MANLRDIRKRIKSVSSTKKITKAMKMVAAARLRRSQQLVEQSRPYAKKLEALLSNLVKSAPADVHPLLSERKVEKRALVVLTSDRGLCGAFNAGLLRTVEKDLKKEIKTSVVPIGRKGISYFGRRNHTVLRNVEDFWTTFSYENVATLAQELAKGFSKNEYDVVEVAFNEYKSVITQKPTTVTLAPVKIETDSTQEPTAEYIYEPGRDAILQQIVPRAIEVRMYLACINSLASEYGARMTAMDSATRNAGEMIDKITLDMNRARQAAITTELMEIISGAEALK